MWVSDVGILKVFAYNLATKAYISAQSFDLETANNIPLGMWSDGTTMWVTNSTKVFAYDLATKVHDENQDFALETTNTGYALWSDGTTMWVGGKGTKVFAYDLATKAYDENQNFSVAVGTNIFGFWSNGAIIWASVSGPPNRVLAFVLTPPPSFVPDTVTYTPQIATHFTQNLPLPMHGTLPYTYALVGTLPHGVLYNPLTRNIFGTPSNVGPTVVSYIVTDANGAQATLTVTIDVVPGPVRFNDTLINYDWDTGQQVSQILPPAIGGTQPIVYSVSGTLPTGVTYDAINRRLIGSPTVETTTTIAFVANDHTNDTAVLTIDITVADPSNLIPAFGVGSVEYTFVEGEIVHQVLPAAAGGTSSLTYQLIGNLPQGMVYAETTRTLTGTPANPREYVLTQEARDVDGDTDTLQVILEIESRAVIGNGFFSTTAPVITRVVMESVETTITVGGGVMEMEERIEATAYWTPVDYALTYELELNETADIFTNDLQPDWKITGIAPNSRFSLRVRGVLTTGNAPVTVTYPSGEMVTIPPHETWFSPWSEPWEGLASQDDLVIDLIPGTPNPLVTDQSPTTNTGRRQSQKRRTCSSTCLGWRTKKENTPESVRVLACSRCSSLPLQ